MSKKPVKRSDKQKEWIDKRNTKNIRSKLEYHLIICEGTKTEPNYFETLKNTIYGQSKEKITIKIIGKGRGTTTLLEEAKKEVQKSTNYISNVWLIFDKDDFSDDSFNKVIQECEEINKQDETIYNPIWSNESFETWILLHFIRLEAPLKRKECISKINENYKKNSIIGKYEKNDKKLYYKLAPYVKDAIQNAKWLEGRYDNTITPAKMNPCTKVYKLVELLNKYI